jgi:hypothetical protein
VGFGSWRFKSSHPHGHFKRLLLANRPQTMTDADEITRYQDEAADIQRHAQGGTHRKWAVRGSCTADAWQASVEHDGAADLHTADCR